LQPGSASQDESSSATADYEQRRDDYYTALGLPRDPETLVTELRDEMRAGLRALNDGLPRNPMVTITGKAGGWIHLTPLEEPLPNSDEPSRLSFFAAI
jgi:hypothetical protein